MSRKALMERDKKRRHLHSLYAKKIEELKKVVKGVDVGYAEKLQAMGKLAKIPRNASKVRIRNRCQITSRPRGYHRKFGVSRLCLRELALNGQIPGMIKSSW